MLAIIIAIILIGLLGVMTPFLLTSRKDVSHARGIQNAKQVAIALFNFENEYGSYPNEETAKLLREKHPEQAHMLKTKSSNDFFRQLIVAGFIDQEVPFHYKQSNHRMSGEGMLEPGKCGFAYVVWSEDPPPGAVLIMGPVKPGETTLDNACNDRSFVLRIDMSVTDPRIDGDFFDWSQPHWGRQKPRIAWPEERLSSCRIRWDRMHPQTPLGGIHPTGPPHYSVKQSRFRLTLVSRPERLLCKAE